MKPINKTAVSVSLSCGIISNIIFPPAFALVGFILGIMVMIRGNEGLGIYLMLSNLIFGTIGGVLGAYGIVTGAWLMVIISAIINGIVWFSIKR